MTTLLDVDSFCEQSVGSFEYREVELDPLLAASGIDWDKIPEWVPRLKEDNHVKYMLFFQADKYFAAKWKFHEEVLEFINEKELATSYVRGLKQKNENLVCALDCINLTADQKEYLLLSATVDNL